MNSDLFRRRWWPFVVKYAAAILFVAIAALVTIGLRKAYPSAPNSLFFCAVILSAWLGGLGPGVVASALACLAIVGFPTSQFANDGLDGTGPRFVVFLLVSMFISWICGRQQRAQAALRQAHDELEQRVRDRTRELTVANEGLKAEIVERKRAEEAVRESQQLLQQVLATLPVGVAVTDQAGDIVLVNAAAGRIWATSFSQAMNDGHKAEAFGMTQAREWARRTGPPRVRSPGGRPRSMS